MNPPPGLKLSCWNNEKVTSSSVDYQKLMFLLAGAFFSARLFLGRSFLAAFFFAGMSESPLSIRRRGGCERFVITSLTSCQ